MRASALSAGIVQLKWYEVTRLARAVRSQSLRPLAPAGVGSHCGSAWSSAHAGVEGAVGWVAGGRLGQRRARRRRKRALAAFLSSARSWVCPGRVLPGEQRHQPQSPLPSFHPFCRREFGSVPGCTAHPKLLLRFPVSTP